MTSPQAIVRRAQEEPTVDRLDASAVVVGQLEVFGVKPLVEGGHDGRGVVGVLKTQSMTQLMDGYQENIITLRKRETEKHLIYLHRHREAWKLQSTKTDVDESGVKIAYRAKSRRILD